MISRTAANCSGERKSSCPNLVLSNRANGSAGSMFREGAVVRFSNLAAISRAVGERVFWQDIGFGVAGVGGRLTGSLTSRIWKVLFCGLQGRLLLRLCSVPAETLFASASVAPASDLSSLILSPGGNRSGLEYTMMYPSLAISYLAYLAVRYSPSWLLVLTYVPSSTSLMI